MRVGVVDRGRGERREERGGESGSGSHGGLIGKVDKLLDEATEGGKHAHASVLELGLTEPLDVILLGEAEGVEANVTDHGAVEGGGAGEEGNRRGVLLHLDGCERREMGECEERQPAEGEMPLELMTDVKLQAATKTMDRRQPHHFKENSRQIKSSEALQACLANSVASGAFLCLTEEPCAWPPHPAIGRQSFCAPSPPQTFSRPTTGQRISRRRPRCASLAGGARMQHRDTGLAGRLLVIPILPPQPCELAP